MSDPYREEIRKLTAERDAAIARADKWKAEANRVSSWMEVEKESARHWMVLADTRLQGCNAAIARAERAEAEAKLWREEAQDTEHEALTIEHLRGQRDRLIDLLKRCEDYVVHSPLDGDISAALLEHTKGR